MKQLILLITILLTPTVTLAYKIKAHQPCGAFVSDYNAFGVDGVMSDVRWVFGFISGVNYSRGDDTPRGTNLDYKTLALWIHNYCNKNPLKNTANAANALIKQLEKRDQ